MPGVSSIGTTGTNSVLRAGEERSQCMRGQSAYAHHTTRRSAKIPSVRLVSVGRVFTTLPSVSSPPPLLPPKPNNPKFPRTDPTVIMAIVNHAGDKVLLGRQRRWPDHFFSCLAGFCEPAESVEEAVRREAWEESGVRVGRVVVHSSQPWPYPASLMLGCIGEALPDGEDINLGHDPELHQADWYPISFVREMLSKPAAGLEEGPPEGFQEVSFMMTLREWD